MTDNQKLVKLFVGQYDDHPNGNGCIYYVDESDEDGFFVANSLVFNLTAYQADMKLDYIVVPEWKAIELEAEFGNERVQYEEYEGEIG